VFNRISSFSVSHLAHTFFALFSVDSYILMECGWGLWTLLLAEQQLSALAAWSAGLFRKKGVFMLLQV
jgi:hypothetical protein